MALKTQQTVTITGASEIDGQQVAYFSLRSRKEKGILRSVETSLIKHYTMLTAQQYVLMKPSSRQKYMVLKMEYTMAHTSKNNL